MPSPLRLAVLGASLQFVPKIARDLANDPAAGESRLAILDREPERAALAGAVAERIAREAGNGLDVAHGADPAVLLADAEAVVVIAGTEDRKEIREEIEVFSAHGLLTTYGDSYGLHAARRMMRASTNFYSIAETIRRHAPGAAVINLSNPMGPLTRLLREALPDRRVVGLCHGYDLVRDGPQGRFAIFRNLDLRGATLLGFNHCTLVAAVRTPEGVVPAEALEPHLATFPGYRLGRRVFREFGLPALLYDEHFLEFFPEWHAEIAADAGPTGLAFWTPRWERQERLVEACRARAAGDAPVPDASAPANDPTLPAARAAVHGAPFVYALNDANAGGLPFLRPEAVTEWVTDHAAPEPLCLTTPLRPALMRKLREMDEFYETLHRAIPAKDLASLSEAVAAIYRDTPLPRAPIERLLASTAGAVWR